MIDFMSVAENKTDAVIERKETTAFNIKQAVDKAADMLKKQFGVQVRKYAEEAKKLVITDDESEKQMISKAGEMKALFAQIDTKRKEIIKYHDQYVRKVNALAKSFKDILDPAIQNLRCKLGNYQYKKELERQKREKKALKEQNILQKQIRKEAEKKGIEAPEMPPPAPVEKKQTITRADDGSSAYIRTEWAFEIIDLSKVPDEYKMLDDKKVNAMIKAGVRIIEGLRIFENPVTVLKIT